MFFGGKDPRYEARGALLRAAGLLAADRLTYEALEEAVGELAFAAVWLAQVPGARNAALKFAVMIRDTVIPKPTPEGPPPRPGKEPNHVHGYAAKNPNAETEEHCPYCGSVMPPAPQNSHDDYSEPKQPERASLPPRVRKHVR